VNPYDPEGVGQAINRALAMPLEERQRRHAHNFRVLSRNDLSHWAERFLTTLEGSDTGGAVAQPQGRAAAGR
jgi:trehalose 6-phosphate synthase